jgi:hypothetical protein
VGGEATYIMVLKDASGIVKMYSMVNVKNYNLVVTSETQEDVFQKYKAALRQSGAAEVADDVLPGEAVVSEIVYVTEAGSTVVYLKTDTGVYRMPFDESVLFIEPGDRITFLKSWVLPSGVTEITDLKKK